MNSQFIKSILQEAKYTKKEGTATSYLWQSGIKILPKTLSISKEYEFSKTAKKGRNLQHSVAGQMIGSFTQKEESSLKQNKPYRLRTQIWRINEFPLFIGYGSIAISDKKGIITKESDLGDLVIFYTSDNWLSIHIYYLPGMITHLNEVMEYLSTTI